MVQDAKKRSELRKRGEVNQFGVSEEVLEKSWIVKTDSSVKIYEEETTEFCDDPDNEPSRMLVSKLRVRCCISGLQETKPLMISVSLYWKKC